jgi:hypothetical protein
MIEDEKLEGHRDLDRNIGSISVTSTRGSI